VVPFWIWKVLYQLLGALQDRAEERQKVSPAEENRLLVRVFQQRRYVFGCLRTISESTIRGKTKKGKYMIHAMQRRRGDLADLLQASRRGLIKFRQTVQGSRWFGRGVEKQQSRESLRLLHSKSH
jgi:hypothetical protein